MEGLRPPQLAITEVVFQRLLQSTKHAEEVDMVKTNHFKVIPNG